MGKKIIIVGAGFAGLSALKTLRKSKLNLDITLIDRDKYFEFTPSIPLAIENPDLIDKIRLPLKEIKEYHNEEVLSVKKNTLKTNKETHNFDYMIVATGSVANFSRFKSLAKCAIPVKRIADIEKINSKLKKAKSVTIIGGGYTGVEVASIICNSKKINLVHSQNQLLPGVNKSAGRKAKRYLEKRGTKLFLNERASTCTPDGIKLESGKEIKSDLVILTTGIRPNDDCLDDNNIDHNLCLKSNEKIFLCGDVARSGILPSAHNAINEGERAAKHIIGMVEDKPAFTEQKDSRFLAVHLGRNYGLMTWKNFAIGLPFIGKIKKIIEKQILFSFRLILDD